MLRDLVRDWFVVYVFGGVTSDLQHAYGGLIGHFAGEDFGNSADMTTDNFSFLLQNVGCMDDEWAGPMYLSLGDWLSTTATIITMVMICIALFLFSRWLIKEITNAFKLGM